MVSQQFPPDWESIDEHFSVMRCGILLGGRRPVSPDSTEAWFDSCAKFLEELSALGYTMPKLTRYRWDPTRNEAISAKNAWGMLNKELATMFALGLDGNVSVEGQARGRVPDGSFVYATECWAGLDAPSWISFGIDLSFVGPLSAPDQVTITNQLIELVRAASSDPNIHYAEVAPQNLSGYRGASLWEDALEPDCFGAGLRLAPRWLRGFERVTFVHRETLAALSNRRAVEESSEFETVIKCSSGLIFVARPNLWTQDAHHDARIRVLVSERLVRDDLLQEAMAFAAAWADGADADELDRHFETLES